MAHIPLPEGLPGITALLAYKPSTGTRLAEFAHELLRGASPLTPAERETIASYVSRLNECEFCARSHGATVQYLDGSLPGDAGPDTPGRLGALLRLASRVAQGGRCTTDQEVADARAAGATDEEIHDTVLVAAAFCMFNRYVDGLAAPTPHEEAIYDDMGARLAEHGYRR
jgi:alkylhydroperoxidase family enzyme